METHCQDPLSITSWRNHPDSVQYATFTLHTAHIAPPPPLLCCWLVCDRGSNRLVSVKIDRRADVPSFYPLSRPCLWHHPRTGNPGSIHGCAWFPGKSKRPIGLRSDKYPRFLAFNGIQLCRVAQRQTNLLLRQTSHGFDIIDLLLDENFALLRRKLGMPLHIRPAWRLASRRQKDRQQNNKRDHRFHSFRF